MSNQPYASYVTFSKMGFLQQIELFCRSPFALLLQESTAKGSIAHKSLHAYVAGVQARLAQSEVAISQHLAMSALAGCLLMFSAQCRHLGSTLKINSKATVQELRMEVSNLRAEIHPLHAPYM